MMYRFLAFSSGFSGALPEGRRRSAIEGDSNTLPFSGSSLNTIVRTTRRFVLLLRRSNDLREGRGPAVYDQERRILISELQRELGGIRV